MFSASAAIRGGPWLRIGARQRTDSEPAVPAVNNSKGIKGIKGVAAAQSSRTLCVCWRAMELAPTHTKRASALPEARHPPRLFSIKGIKLKLVGLLTLGRPCMR